ncbi:hypothetical protein GQ53DRAFT_755633 [Thozetella sp. PMI_491]|nr:hypothetical protein GQ53DRAFT_755633 [Thozetella sp. PMI_491]
MATLSTGRPATNLPAHLHHTLLCGLSRLQRRVRLATCPLPLTRSSTQLPRAATNQESGAQAPLMAVRSCSTAQGHGLVYTERETRVECVRYSSVAVSPSPAPLADLAPARDLLRARAARARGALRHGFSDGGAAAKEGRTSGHKKVVVGRGS